MQYRLSEILTPEETQNLLDSLCSGRGIGSAIVEPDGTVLAYSGWKQICTEFHRTHPETAARCLRNNPLPDRSSGDSYTLKTCPNGLVDVVIPLKVGDKVCATLYAGQFLLDEPDITFFKSQAQRFGFDEDAYLAALAEIPVVGKKQIEAHVRHLTSLTEHLVATGLREKQHRERLKELHCVYGIADIIEEPGISLDTVFQKTATVMQAAWQYPEITCVRIGFQGNDYTTENFRETSFCQTADILLGLAAAGSITVCYLEERPELDEGPFLREERKLLDHIAARLARAAERSLSEERLAHLNRVLLAIRNVNQLITAEDNPQKLIERACAELTETRGYYNAWIALLDEDGSAVRMTASSGFNGGFTAMSERLKRGEFSSCMQRALKDDTVVTVADPPAECTDCPLAAEYEGRAGLIRRLAYDGTVYGILSVSVPGIYARDDEELDLFEEVANDLSFALNKIRHEEQLRRFNHIIATLPHPMSFVSRDYRYLAVNDIYASLYSVACDRIVGRSIADYCGREIFETEIRPYMDLCLAGEIVSFEVQFDFPGRGRRWMQMDYFPYRNEIGEIEGIISHGHDITSRRKAEDDIRQSRHELDILNRIANLFLTVQDSDLYQRVLEIILEATHSRHGFFGFIDENGNLECPSMTQDIWEQCSMPDKSIVFPRKSWGGLWGTSLLEKKTVYSNTPLHPPRGHLALRNAVAVPLVHHDRLVGQITVGNSETDYTDHDISFLESVCRYISSILYEKLEKQREEQERESIEEKLQQSQKMEAIGTLAGGIAHDFNNMLGVIMGNTELLLDDCAPGTEAYFSAGQIREASERARDLVKQILTFSRRARKQMASLNMAPLVKEALKMMRSTIPATVEIVQQIDCPHDNIVGDATQLHQVLMNLCVNAEHAMHESGGTLTVTMKNKTLQDSDIRRDQPELQAGEFVELAVSDTGHGIEPDILDRIFEPFFTTKEVDRGTGLGLSVVHGIIRNHGGAIDVESRPGRGTTFRALLPVAVGVEQEKHEGQRDIPTGSGRILLVDDEETMVMIAERMLKKLGYEAHPFRSSEQALAAFTENPDAYDLVISDMTMPRMTGKALAREVMKIRPDKPVILCTGFSDQLSEDEGREIGIKSFILKPYKKEALAQAIRQAIDPTPAS